MGKILVKKKANKYIITNRLDVRETINERIINQISRGMYQEFIPLTITQKKKNIVLGTTVEGLIPLNIYFSGVVSKGVFLDVVIKLIKIIKICEQNTMNANNLDFDIGKIFLEPQSKAIHVIYWPVVNNALESSPSEFFKRLPYYINFFQFEDQSYINEYASFFNGIDPFSINNFEKLIKKLLGVKPTENNSPSGRIGNYKTPEQPNDQSDDAPLDIAYDPFKQIQDNKESAAASVFCTSCGRKNDASANFCIGCGQKLEKLFNNTNKNEENEAQKAQEYDSDMPKGTAVLGPNVGGTTVLGAEFLDRPSFPYLIREKTQEKVYVDKPVFRIGKEKRYCDLFVSDNPAVSRSHADIITKDNKYYIKDLNSTNRTYVNERVIPIETEIEIFSGTKLRLANEDFVFYIE